jgi:hypothetical protein
MVLIAFSISSALALVYYRSGARVRWGIVSPLVVVLGVLAASAWYSGMGHPQFREVNSQLVGPKHLPVKGAGPTDAEVEALIAQLRSPNRNPNPDLQPGGEHYPDDYDLPAQEKVQIAREKLTALGKDACPALIRHLDDKEYCLSFSTAVFRGFSVGEVCFMILEGQVDPAPGSYKSRLGTDGREHNHRGYLSKFCGEDWFTKKGVEQWWQGHQHQTLREMQMTALRWAIERERHIGFPQEDDKKYFLDPLLEKLDALTKK